MNKRAVIRIIKLSVSVMLMFVSLFVLFNQIKAYKSFKNIEKSKDNGTEINWASDNLGAFREHMKEELNTTERAEPVIAYENGNSEIYVINKKSKMIHSADCASAKKIHSENKITISKQEFEEYLENGYSICSVCNAGR